MEGEKKGKPQGFSVEENMGTGSVMFSPQGEEQITRPSVLLHSCCGPCSTAVVERLIEDYQLTIFFYNPNITDEEEYMRRREAQISFIKQFNEDPAYPYQIGYKEGEYTPTAFIKVAKEHKEEPEGGTRCTSCFQLRMKKTAEMALLWGYDFFATAMTVSPHKDYQRISSLGKALALHHGISYLDMDFKKKAGFQRSIVLSKKYDLYRQRYCGCEYSKR